ncbi:MAG: GNAT family N-acetyltransferase [Saprospiraceae bacterium]|nr:GNAT family N-acetyltransferase [Saprospiraceae bacterium]
MIYIDYWLTENPINSGFCSNLIQNFCKEILKKGKRIKWTFEEYQQAVYQLVKTTGNLREERVFYHYNLDLINYFAKLNVSSDRIYCALCTELNNSEENKQLINLFAHWTQPSLEKLKTWIQEKKLFKFQQGTQLIGAALVNDHDKQIELVQIIIRSEDRGKGYGIVCLDLFIQDIRSNRPSCQEIYLDVNQENQIARKLYESLGFQVSRRKNYLYQCK